MAYQHVCEHAHNPAAGYAHDRGQGKPTRKRCRYCKGSFIISEGQYGVFVWRGDGHYPLANAVAVFQREIAATAHTMTNPDYVVRWIAA